MQTLVLEMPVESELPVTCATRPSKADFAALYEAHSRAVYYLALRFLGDPTRAEDVTHDVFLKAFRNLRQSWHSRHVFSNADETVMEIGGVHADSPLKVLETKELGQRIQKTLDTLPEEYRLLLLLVADEELSYDEIAALTDQTTDAVRGKLHRARKTFAQLFQKSA